MPDFMIPSSPLVSGLVALIFIAGTCLACGLMRFTDSDDDE
mgnify:CR=1 FL=1|jgi:hypothetical protein